MFCEDVNWNGVPQDIMAGMCNACDECYGLYKYCGLLGYDTV
jgi:hypothetical protein